MASPHVRIRLGSGCYDRMVPFLTGEVPTDGIDVTFVPIDTPGEIFRRMRDGDFEAGEVASSELLRWVSAGDDALVGIPVFPVRVFRHGMIWVRCDAGIATPKDFEGKRVGLSQWPQTAALWIRGMFAHEYGVDLTAISWQHEPQFPVPPAVAAGYRITANRSGRLLDDLLIDGEIDAYIGARISDAAQRSPSVQRLWPDYKERERDYFRRTRLFPIMHTIAIRRDLYERDPFVARSLFDALIAAKEIARSKMRYLGTLRYMLPWMFAEIEELDAVFGRDPFVDGLEPNRPELEMTLKYLREQALLDGPVTLEDAFADVGR